jgi:hypothetical protein
MNGRMKYGRRDKSRVEGRFVALPHDVLDSAAFMRLGYPARALLLEIARQYMGANNGQLLASKNYLKKRGWSSSDVISRAKKESIEGGFIHETVKGRRPNRASWYAVTWLSLQRHPQYDEGAPETFKKAAYRSAAENASACPAAGRVEGQAAPVRGIQIGKPVRVAALYEH